MVSSLPFCVFLFQTDRDYHSQHVEQHLRRWFSSDGLIQRAFPEFCTALVSSKSRSLWTVSITEAWSFTMSASIYGTKQWVARCSAWALETARMLQPPLLEPRSLQDSRIPTLTLPRLLLLPCWSVGAGLDLAPWQSPTRTTAMWSRLPYLFKSSNLRKDIGICLPAFCRHQDGVLRPVNYFV